MPKTKKSSTRKPITKKIAVKKSMKGGMQMMQKNNYTKRLNRLTKKGVKGGSSIAIGSATGALVGATVGGIAGAALSNRRYKKVSGDKGMKGGIQMMQKTTDKTTAVRKKGMKGGASVALGSAAGALVGATVGGIAGAALSNEKTRRAVGHSITDFAKNAQHNIEALSQSSEDIKRSTRELTHTAKNVQSRMKKK